MFEKLSKVLRWVVDIVPFLGDVKSFRTKIVNCLKDEWRAYNTVKAVAPNLSEISKWEKKAKTENLSKSKKQIICNHFEQL